MADRLSSPFIDLLRLTKDFSISQLAAPKKFVGKKVKDLELYKDYQLYCIGIKRGDEIESIDPEHVIMNTNKLVLSDNKENLEKIAKL